MDGTSYGSVLQVQGYAREKSALDFKEVTEEFRCRHCRVASGGDKAPSVYGKRAGSPKVWGVGRRRPNIEVDRASESRVKFFTCHCS